MPDEDLRQLIEQNLELTQKLVKDMRKIRHHFWMASVWFFIKFAILVVPLIGGYFFLKPYIGTLQNAYEQVLGVQKSVQGLQQNIGELKDGVKSIQGAAQGMSGGTLPEGMNLPALPSLESLFGKK